MCSFQSQWIFRGLLCFVVTTSTHAGCPNLTNLEIIDSHDRHDGRSVTVQCNNSVLVNGQAIIERQTTLICNHSGGWETPIPECYEGKVLDLNTAPTELTYTHDTTVLLFCDQFTANMENINISIGGLVSNGKKFAWTVLTVTQVHHHNLVTCQQMSRDQQHSSSRSVKLNIQFPPSILPHTTIKFQLPLHQPGYAELKFNSNPTLQGNDAVTAFRRSKPVHNIYYVTDRIENRIVLHFTNVTKMDYGEYSVVIRTPEPFTRTYEVKMIITLSEDQKNMTHTVSETDAWKYTSMTLAGLLCVFIVITVAVAIKQRKDNNSTPKTKGKSKQTHDATSKVEADSISLKSMEIQEPAALCPPTTKAYVNAKVSNNVDDFYCVINE